MVKFLRRSTDRYAKLGKGRKKKQKWKKPTGRDNKMREKRRGYPLVVSIGYRSDKKERTFLKNKEPVKINNVADLEKIKGDKIGLISAVGKKKKIEIAKKAKEMKIELYNMNANKFLKINEKKSKKKKLEPSKKEEDKKENEKEVKEK